MKFVVFTTIAFFAVLSGSFASASTAASISVSASASASASEAESALLQNVASHCQVQTASAAADQDGAVFATMSCQDGSQFELKQVALSSSKCSSSFWCNGMEHCVGGKCVPKDFFHQCDMFHSCSFGDKCVGGVCKH